MGNSNANTKENVQKILDLTYSDFFKDWKKMFQRLLDYKKEFDKTTVSRKYHDKELYRWYRHLKKIVNHPDVELPDYYTAQLKSIDFYFGDGHYEQEKKVTEKWLALLQEAIDEGVNIQANHRFKYKGKGLGTWLVGVAKKNKQGKQLDVTERMKEMGFDMEGKNKSPENVVKRFINDLLEDENPVKFLYQTRFNQYVINKKDILKPYLIQAVNDVWKFKFNEERSWEINDFVHRWKKFRYSLEKNPEGKWFVDLKTMGRVYNYALRRKENPEKMKEIIHRFTEKELDELRNEGFTVDFD